MLWFLRHAEAADGRPDEARPLTQHGVHEAQTVGAALAQLGVHIDVCLSSPKRRAMETARLACEPLGIEIVLEPALAGSSFDPERLAAGHGDVMLVGHNPSISSGVRELTGARVNIRKAGIAAVERSELVVLMTPTQLSAIAGMPEPAA